MAARHGIALPTAASVTKTITLGLIVIVAIVCAVAGAIAFVAAR